MAGEILMEHLSVTILPDGRLSRPDAAVYLGVSVPTLKLWIVKKRGPDSVKVGGQRFYFKDDLDRFIRGE